MKFSAEYLSDFSSPFPFPFSPFFSRWNSLRAQTRKSSPGEKAEFPKRQISPPFIVNVRRCGKKSMFDTRSTFPRFFPRQQFVVDINSVCRRHMANRPRCARCVQRGQLLLNTEGQWPQFRRGVRSNGGCGSAYRETLIKHHNYHHRAQPSSSLLPADQSPLRGV